MYGGEPINYKAKIQRNKLDKTASLSIDIPTKWELYAGLSIKHIDYDKPILEGVGAGVFPLDINNSIRTYFSLCTQDSKVILADNHLPMTGGFNFRDLGGIKTTTGKHIKWGKLFRADEMSSLTDEDLTYLASIPIRSVIDFRARPEARRSPDRVPNTARFFYPIAITPASITSEKMETGMLANNLELQMKENNRTLISDPACVRAFRSLFTILQNALSAPIIYHCTAGKDRTGMATALLLTALGVDEKTIMDDYLSSNIFLDDKYAASIKKYPRTEPMFTVRKSYLQAGINQIKKDHGTILNFVTKILKVDIQKLRDMYLIEEDELED